MLIPTNIFFIINMDIKSPTIRTVTAARTNSDSKSGNYFISLYGALVACIQ